MTMPTKLTLAVMAALLLPLQAVAQSPVPPHMVPMPAAIVLIVCKTVVAGPPDQNAGYTKAENREWATEHAMMVCRREEVQMYDRAVDGGADPQAFNAQRCQRSAMMLGPQWDASHQSSSYRFWRVACPVPIVRQNATRKVARPGALGALGRLSRQLLPEVLIDVARGPTRGAIFGSEGESEPWRLGKGAASASYRCVEEAAPGLGSLGGRISPCPSGSRSPPAPCLARR